VSARGEIARLVDQYERAYAGEAWHGMPVRELLSDVDARLAAAHPIAGGHSIWELVAHITWWLDAAKRRVAGETVESAHDEDWPATPSPTAAAWAAARAALQSSHDRLVAAIGRLEPKDLDRPVPGHPYSVYVLLHGVLQHTLYHGGQIGLLRRAGRG
jgi:uncharacterized damage-inducible protein DinB